MANNPSQKKRNRQTVTRTARNKAIRSEIKTRQRHAVEAAAAGDADAARAALVDAQRRIDSATSKGVLHANTAARKKSRLVKRVATLLDA